MRIEVFVVLRSGRPDSRTFRGVEHLELDPRGICDTSHHTAQGINLIAELVQRAGDRIIILPGCGIKEDNIGELVSKTGVQECHVTGKHQVPSEMKFFNDRVFMGVPGAPEYEKTVVDPERIRIYRQAAEASNK